jgi:hypothetical protein
VYTPPAGTKATANTTILSAPYNSFVDDLTADANAARPVTAGGTGATSASGARAAIGADDASNLIKGTLPNGRLSGEYSGFTATSTNIEVTGSTWSASAPVVSGFTLTGSAPNVRFKQTDGTSAHMGVNGGRLELWSDIAGDMQLDGRVLYVELTPDGSGDFIFGDKTVWHSGNDGSGSGLDADLLDGQEGAYYRNISNMNAGTLPNARFSGSYDGVANFSMSGTLKISSSAPVIQLIDTSSGSYSARMRVDANNVYFDSSTDDVTFGEVFRFELDTKIGYVASSRIWTEALAATRSIVAGNGLTGGGTLGGTRTVAMGTPGTITNSSTSVVTTESHNHALGFIAAEVSTTTSASTTSFGLGHVIMGLHNTGLARNASVAICLDTGDGDRYISSAYGTAGTQLAGTWRSRGNSASNYHLLQRVA